MTPAEVLNASVESVDRLTLVLPHGRPRPPGFPRGELLCETVKGNVYSFDAKRMRAWATQVLHTARNMTWICLDCAKAVGVVMPPGHAYTAHEDTCGVCGEIKTVTEPRDFRWPV